MNDLFPNATSVQRYSDPTPENIHNINKITGPIKTDWSNAIMRNHPVYVVDGRHLYGWVPDVDSNGNLRTDADDHLLATMNSFDIPTDHPWYNPTEEPQP